MSGPLHAQLSLYAAIGTRSFRRYSTYTAATLAGIFTNSVFGIILSFAYLALWEQNPTAGGYAADQAVTYVWIGQALLMTIALWSGGSTDDLAERIRSGDIAVDLYRPVSVLGWYLAADLGRALYHFISSGVAPTIVGALVFGLVTPSPAAAAGFLASTLSSTRGPAASRIQKALVAKRKRTAKLTTTASATLTRNPAAAAGEGVTGPNTSAPTIVGATPRVTKW